MPKNKKDDSTSSDSDSGPDDREPLPKKSKSDAAKKSKADDDKKSKADAGKKSKDEKKIPIATGPNEWVLEGMRMAKVNTFNGKKRVDIREHYEKDGKIMPGKKGISLTAFQWQMLLDNADKITDALK